ncbi:MAG: CAP domain-containing protein [Labilithrix sp.]|nr:CAP domain-containing protein [Labilithrix sp.]
MTARLLPPLTGIVCAVIGCTPMELFPGSAGQLDAPSALRSSSAEEHHEADVNAWAPVTKSPWEIPEGEVRDAREESLAKACGTRDGALDRVAHELAAARARGLGVDPDAVSGKMRAAGEPHVRPRVVFASGHAPLDDVPIKRRLTSEAFGGREGARRPTRCGIALMGTPHGGEVFVAVAVEALADMAPLATRARAGEWLSFEAKLHVPARSAKLVILGPRGAPRTVPTSLDAATGRARAKLTLDQPGAFTLQLVGDLDEGPRPLLEARVFADVAPTAPGEDPIAPGEDAAADLDEGREADALVKMLGAVRAMEGLPPLRREPRLEALARAHAEQMRDRREVAHDVGEGDFRARFEGEASMAARAVGENVARAASVRLAHRALYASPSHRINLLRNDYTHVGVGVARAPDGSVYVCEAFAAAR